MTNDEGRVWNRVCGTHTKKLLACSPAIDTLRHAGLTCNHHSLATPFTMQQLFLKPQSVSTRPAGVCAHISNHDKVSAALIRWVHQASHWFCCTHVTAVPAGHTLHPLVTSHEVRSLLTAACLVTIRLLLRQCACTAIQAVAPSQQSPATAAATAPAMCEAPRNTQARPQH